MPIAVRLLAVLLAMLPRLAAQETWFVAPTGSDEAPGTKEAPFATVLRAQRAANPGDTVFLRGGTYAMREDQIARRRGIFASIIHLNKNGTPGKPITYTAFENERPVFDCSSVKPKDQRVTAFLVTASYIHLKGFSVTGVQVTMTGHTQSICFESQGSHNIFERLAMHDGQAIGIYHVRGSHNLFLNCDAWNNWDFTSERGRGGNVDGFGCHPTEGSVGNVFRGCRAWFNSDDGFDCITAYEAVTFENCWAFYNGFSPSFERRADGNGFKLGGYGSLPAAALPRKVPRHVIRFSIAARNKDNGFYANHHPGGGDWFHNSAFRNGAADFNMLCRLPDNRTDVDGFGHVLKNNLSFNGRRALVKVDARQCEIAANAFDQKLTEADFLSVDERQLILPRQADGSLPAIDFLRPHPKSRLVDAGIEVGLPFRGNKPEIGAFESVR
jgi:hypothetical protein